MDIEKPFASYAEMETRLVKLRVLRDTHALRFEDHWRALADKDVRSELFKGAVQGAVHEFKPAQKITELLSGGGIASQLIMGMITRRGGIMRRLLTSVAVMAAPNLLAKFPWAKAIDLVRNKMGQPSEHEMNGHS
jgi:hypothetical protein